MTDPYIVAIPFGVAVLLVYTVVYVLSHRQHPVAWTVTLIGALVTWFVIAYVVVSSSRVSPLCVPIQSIPDGSCPQGPHWPTAIGYGVGFLVIVLVGFLTRPKQTDES